MKNCPICGAPLAENAVFCLNCGFEDNTKCSECGSPRSPDSTFCAVCGKQFLTAQPAKTELMPVPVAETAAAPIPVGTVDPMTSPVTRTAPDPLTAAGAASSGSYSAGSSYSSGTSSYGSGAAASSARPDPSPAPVYGKAARTSYAPPKSKLVLNVPILVAAAGIIVVAIGVTIFFVTLPGRKYKKAVKAYDRGDYAAAASQFEAMGNFRDAVERAEEATKMMHYDNGQKAFDSGDFEKAKEEFAAAGDFKDAPTMITTSERAGHYQKAAMLLTSGDYKAAITEFEYSDRYNDASEQIRKCYYQLGEAALAKDSLDEAVEYFNLAGTYSDASRKSSEINYKRAETAYNSGDVLLAAKYFSEAGAYNNADKRAKEIYYTLGVTAYKKKDYVTAAEHLRLAGNYKDAETYANAAYYTNAVTFLKAKNYEKAGLYLGLAGTYKNADQLMIKSIQNLVNAKQYENAQLIVKNYSGTDAGSWSNYIDGMVAFKNKDFASAAEHFRLAGDFLNSQVCYTSSLYNEGIVLFKSKSYSNARTYFAKCGKYKFAQDLVKICDGEIHYAAGRILKASQQYAKVSKKFTLAGFNFKSRKTHIDGRLTLERAKGDWIAKGNKITVVHTDVNGYTNDWYASDLWSGQYLKLSFEMNSDGTFNITIEVCFGRYTSYADYSSDLTSDRRTIKKTYTKQKKLPTSIKLDTNVTLKYVKSTFTIAYSKIEKTADSATNQFSSVVSYKKAT